MLDVAEITPVVNILPPVKLPATDINPEDNTFPLALIFAVVRSPVELIIPLVNRLPPVMLLEADNKPVVNMFPLKILPTALKLPSVLMSPLTDKLDNVPTDVKLL